MGKCDKCEDVHKAQLEGKTNKPCECGCHGTSFFTDTGSTTQTFRFSGGAVY